MMILMSTRHTIQLIKFKEFFVEICYLAQSLLQVIKHLSLKEGLVAADWKKLLLLSIF